MVQWKSCAASLLAVQLAGAWNPATDRATCNEDRSPCLTSFVWCASGTRDSNPGCYYPDRAYPYFNRDFASNPAALLTSARYNLSWQNFNPDYPVMVTLNFGRTSDVYDSLGNGNWSRNITDASFFEFSFAEIVQEFPTQGWNLTPAAVCGLLGNQFATFDVTQPEAPVQYSTSLRRNVSAWAYSDQFAVFDGYARPFLETQADIGRENEENKWRKGVGIGVGVGVPLLLAGAFLGGWAFGKRKGNKKAITEAKLSTSS